MAELAKTYVFLGSGTVWDPENEKVLCRFGTDGKLATSNPYIISKLMAMRVPFVDNDRLLQQNAEYAIEILTDRVNMLEQINAEQRAELELYRAQERVDRDNDSREALFAELDYYGIPYVVTSNASTLRALMDEFRTYQKNATKLRIMEGIGSGD